MANYNFGAACRKKGLDGVVPGEMLVDSVAQVLRRVYPEVTDSNEKWVRDEVEKFLAEEGEERTFPVLALNGPDGRIIAGITYSRVAEPEATADPTAEPDAAKPAADIGALAELPA